MSFFSFFIYFARINRRCIFYEANQRNREIYKYIQVEEKRGETVEKMGRRGGLRKIRMHTRCRATIIYYSLLGHRPRSIRGGSGIRANAEVSKEEKKRPSGTKESGTKSGKSGRGYGGE